MKLWHKVFLCTFILFELLFNAASFYLIEHSFNESLKKEIDSGLSEQLLVRSQIQTDWIYLGSAGSPPETAGIPNVPDGARNFLHNNASKYTRYFNTDAVFIEILDAGNSAVFSDFAPAVPGVRAELEGLSPDSRRYLIRDIGGRTYLFVSSPLTLDGTDFKLSYIRDISGVYGDKEAQIGLFFKMNIVITVILAAGLYALIWFLTRSVRALNKSAQTIAGGDYSQRVPVLSGDEIGVLARSFNRMADAVESKVDALEETARSRQVFINSLTHELKTPLTAIIGYADYLRTAKYNEEAFYKALDYIYTEGKRLERLSFKLMDLILAGNGALSLSRVNILPLLNALESALKPQLDAAGVFLAVKAEPALVPLERDLFGLLCTNLLDNALKASQAGGRIRLRGRIDGGHYLVEIEDEGSGIPEEDIPRIFEPFFTADRAKTKAHHGAGLGLAICAEIVRFHKGGIGIESRINEGTTVTVRFAI